MNKLGRILVWTLAALLGLALSSAGAWGFARYFDDRPVVSPSVETIEVLDREYKRRIADLENRIDDLTLILDETQVRIRESEQNVEKKKKALLNTPRPSGLKAEEQQPRFRRIAL